jgi:hypothetical protein
MTETKTINAIGHQSEDKRSRTNTYIVTAANLQIPFAFQIKNSCLRTWLAVRFA